MLKFTPPLICSNLGARAITFVFPHLFPLFFASDELFLNLFSFPPFTLNSATGGAAGQRRIPHQPQLRHHGGMHGRAKQLVREVYLFPRGKCRQSNFQRKRCRYFSPPFGVCTLGDKFSLLTSEDRPPPPPPPTHTSRRRPRLNEPSER